MPESFGPEYDEPKLDDDLIKMIPGSLKLHPSMDGVEVDVSQPTHGRIHVRMSDGRVTTFFTVDPITLAVKLDEEKTKDLFSGNTDVTATDSVSHQVTEETHNVREVALKEIVEELADPTLIDEEDDK